MNAIIPKAMLKVNFYSWHFPLGQNVERAFSLLKRRFRRLHLLNQKSHERAVIVVMAACILHNICIMEQDNVDYYLLCMGHGQQVNILNYSYLNLYILLNVTDFHVADFPTLKVNTKLIYLCSFEGSQVSCAVNGKDDTINHGGILWSQEGDGFCYFLQSSSSFVWIHGPAHLFNRLKCTLLGALLDNGVISTKKCHYVEGRN